jgi:uracil-DNA glycosylase family 4
LSALDDLCQRIDQCRDCDLCQRRNRAVPGEGPEDAEVLFIGEAPGWHENQQGRPFVGPAGKFLDELLAMAGLERSGVYICNVIKCQPPDNRDPLPTEIAACKKWLERQLEIIRPRLIVTLGRYSMARFFGGESISKTHGRPVRRDGVVYYPMYHPAAALHQQSLRRTIEEDMRRIPLLLADVRSTPEEDKETKPQQLSFF